MDVVPFQLTRPLPSAVHPTLARLREGVGKIDYGLDDNTNDATNLLLTARTNDNVAEPPLTRPALDHAPGGSGGGGGGSRNPPNTSQHQS